MNIPRRSRNPKRRLHPSPKQERLAELAEAVDYGGHPHHKRSPGDFGLTPPASPRPNKSLCDGVGIFRRAAALDHLVDGIRHGTVSADADQGFPRHVWSLIDGVRVLEARCDNFQTGRYHGYPIETDDPMADLVIEKWKEQDDGATAV